MQISHKEGNGEETMQKETTKKWVEEAFGKQQQSECKEFQMLEKERLATKENQEIGTSSERVISNEAVSNSRSDSNAKIMDR